MQRNHGYTDQDLFERQTTVRTADHPRVTINDSERLRNFAIVANRLETTVTWQVKTAVNTCRIGVNKNLRFQRLQGQQLIRCR